MYIVLQQIQIRTNIRFSETLGQTNYVGLMYHEFVH